MLIPGEKELGAQRVKELTRVHLASAFRRLLLCGVAGKFRTAQYRHNQLHFA